MTGRVLGAMALLAVTVAAAGTGYRYDTFPAGDATDAEAEDAAWKQAATRAQTLCRQYDRLAPAGVHVVIDQTHNRLSLRKGHRVLRDAVCSGGSGMVLREHDAARTWVFDTPRGVFHVKTKLVDPLWRKPDWAFVEEGRPVPKDPRDRFERGTLGEFALSFGDGYLIHGTLYTRLLGRSVSHGCVRLGAEDLREVYRAAEIGTPILIF